MRPSPGFSAPALTMALALALVLMLAPGSGSATHVWDHGVHDAPAPHESDNSGYREVVSAIPECGLRCVLALTPGAAAANATAAACPEGDCLCEGDAERYTTVLACVRGRCSVEESIETARAAWSACGSPRRSRKADLLGPLALEATALLCVLLRLLSRWWMAALRLEVDDYIMMVVTVLYVAFECVGTMAAQMAFGVDIWTVDAAALTLSAKFFYVGETFYLVILTLTKVSILCFYMRIFSSRIFRLASLAVMVWVGLSGLMFVLLQIFQCTPIEYIWEGWKQGAFGPWRCIDVNALAFCTAAFSIAQDIVILLMPLPVLARLDVSRRSRLAIMLMFSLGIFVTVTSCVRLWTITSFGDSVNPTWDYTNVLIWTGLEVAVSIIVTSLPAIRVLFGLCLGRDGSNASSNDHGPGGNSSKWKGRGRGRRHRRRGFTSTPSTTSSFGNDTYIASWSSAPPALKRISAVSRISSIVPSSDVSSGFEFDDTLPPPLHGGGDMAVHNTTSEVVHDKDSGGGRGSGTSGMMMMTPGRHSCPPNLPTPAIMTLSAKRSLSPMPSIGDVLHGTGVYANGEMQTQTQMRDMRCETRTSAISASSTAVASESPSPPSSLDY